MFEQVFLQICHVTFFLLSIPGISPQANHVDTHVGTHYGEKQNVCTFE